MESKLRENCQSVFEARSAADLFSCLKHLAEHLGFSLFSGSAVIDHFTEAPPLFKTIHNVSSAYLELYADTSIARSDPVMQHCKATGVPLLWDRSTYEKAGQLTLWEQQAQFGYECGLTMAMHLPHGRHFVMGVERDQALPTDPVETSRLVSALVMFAVYAQSSFMTVLLADAPTQVRVKLTARELETLRWTLEGKTAWEIGRIFGIAENTVIRHAQHAMQKLECNSKHHAAVKALRLGLIR